MIGGKMKEDEEDRNVSRVYEICETGKLAKERGGKLTLNAMALAALLYMAHVTYDWPPSKSVRRKMLPCRLYTLGWKGIATTLNMTMLSQQQIESGGDLNAMIKTRETTAKNRISQAWKFLAERGLIKQLYPQSLGRNAGYLLLLGDDDENREVEAWARKCIGK